MVRRTHLVVSVLILATLLVVPALETFSLRITPPAAAQSSDLPSILVIQTDDMRADDLKAMPKTRNLLQSGGMTFTNYMSGGTPLCCPNRATALTGEYPHNHGVWRNNKGPHAGHRAFVEFGREERSVAVALHDEALYETGFLGKYLNGYPSQGPDNPNGWDHWHALIQDRKQPEKGYYYNYKLNNNGSVKKYGSKNKDYTVNVMQRQALAIIRNRDTSRPLFLLVNPRAPHGPPVPAKQDRGKNVPTSFKTPAFDAKGRGKLPSIRKLPKMKPALKQSLEQQVAQRRRTLLSVDRMIAKLYAAMPPNSYIFFTSDNGYVLGEFRVAAGKSLPYKAAAEVPLLVAHKPAQGQAPKIQPGSRYDHVTSSIDLAPTWADLAGTTMPAADGLSLVGILHGDSGPVGNRDSILLEFVTEAQVSPASDSREPRSKDDSRQRKKKQPKQGLASQGKKSKNTGVLQPYLALRGDDWLYVEWSKGHKEYYDHTNDQFELNNIYNRLPDDRKQTLADQLDAMKTCAGASCT